MIRFDNILEKVSPYYSEKEITQLQKAYVFAGRAHKGQVRRSGEPYLSHPLEVTDMLADMKLDATTLTAGLLHDVLEDTDVTAPDLQKAFGNDVTHLVEGVTKISLVQESSPETRHAETIRKIILAMTDDLRVIFIKLADRIHNLKTLKFLAAAKQTSIAKETLEIYAPIASRLGMGRIKAELEDLSFRYVESDSYFQITKKVDSLRKGAEKNLENILQRLEDQLKEHLIQAQIYYRIKRPYSIYAKMKRQSISFDQVYDFVALRIIADSVKHCYAALGAIHQAWPHLPYRFRDFIAIPKPNHYQALHTTIITEKKHTIEIQIRTQEMHNLAENGIAAHWRYKEARPQSMEKDDKRLEWLREMAELYQDRKDPRKFLKSLKTNLIPEEVYVFTPKGKIITLPLGATALDFAFRIHSEIGRHAAEAKIDGKPVPLKTILKPGNIVEIMTSEKKAPSRDWLNIAFTGTSRHHIKRWLNQQERIKHTALGKKLWGQELAKYKLPSSKLKSEYALEQLKETLPFRIKDMSDFYALVGFGKVVLSKKLMEGLLAEDSLVPRKKPLIQKVVTKVTKKPKSIILLKDREGMSVNLAKCCAPIKGEPIIGYITAGKGITVHSLRCSLVEKEVLSSERMVEVSWDGTAKGSYSGTLLIKGKDSPGVLAQLTAAIAKHGGNITKARVDTSAEGTSQTKITLTIEDIKHLNNIIKKISEIKEISAVDRV
ncbi:MAG: RelA/SpoT family protein [Candidatus Aminicenantes bacterium]|nr:RelA/SpoT family protein [Candidatus Aminicenantes bacterium]